jgi:amidohydrolase
MNIVAWLACVSLVSSVAASAQAIEAAPVRDSVRLQISDIEDLAYSIYVSIHQHPELGHQEHNTQKLLKDSLVEAGYQTFVDVPSLPTAVITVLDTKRSGPTIALRAEMDARETIEDPSHDPISLVDGRMHNCGHDAHAAMLLASAAYLLQNQHTIVGRIVFIFQPAEEVRGGADDLVNDNILVQLGAEAIFAQHVVSDLPVGTISLGRGSILAGSSYFTLTVRGQGSHAAMPSEGDDTLVAAAKMLVGLAELPGRRFSLVDQPIVVSPTRIESNSNALNIVPSQVEVQGTIRSFHDLAYAADGLRTVQGVIQGYLDGAASALGVEYEWIVRKGAPPTVNDEVLFDKTVNELRKHWPATVDSNAKRGMFSEDFAYYSQQVPSLYFGLGIQKGELGTAGVHTPEFNIHPEALNYGIRLMVYLAQLHTRGKIVPIDQRS